MAMSFGSGKATYKYDNQVPDEVKAKLDDISSDLLNTSNFIEGKVTSLETLVRENNDIFKNYIDALQSENRVFKNELDYVVPIVQYNQEYLDIISAFIHSKLFRFLNIFGKWYFRDINNNYYLNTKENHCYHVKYKSNFRYSLEDKIRRLKAWYYDKFHH